MNRISLDLELEQPKSNTQTPDSLLDVEKIIQVGYVVFDDQTGEIIKEVCKEVNIFVPLSNFIKKLTGISNKQISDGTDLVSIIDGLKQDCLDYKCSRKILTWGAGDQECIVRELPGDYQWIFGRSAFNVKHLYQLYRETNGKNPSGGLSKSMKNMGINFKGSAHNALADAINTATIFMALKDKLREPQCSE
jgi:inhibitor of KinA sporulation pathway (predicted exonuclease)